VINAGKSKSFYLYDDFLATPSVVANISAASYHSSFPHYMNVIAKPTHFVG
jgi:hypothetical protein